MPAHSPTCLIILTADTSSSSHPCCSECTWACQYTEIHGAFQGIHESQEPGCDKCGVNDKCIDSIILHVGGGGGCFHDQCGACSGSPQLGNWELWQLLWSACTCSSQGIQSWWSKLHSIVLFVPFATYLWPAQHGTCQFIMISVDWNWILSILYKTILWFSIWHCSWRTINVWQPLCVTTFGFRVF